jgi:hypothetical protein
MNLCPSFSRSVVTTTLPLNKEPYVSCGASKDCKTESPLSELKLKASGKRALRLFC